MIINGEEFSQFELDLWDESIEKNVPLRNENLLWKILSVMASAVLGWWK